MPSLLLVLQDEWQRSDAAFGLAYFVIALLLAAGALSSGLLAQRMGRRILLPAGAALIASGMGWRRWRRRGRCSCSAQR